MTRRFGEPDRSIAAIFRERQENGGKKLRGEKPMIYSGVYLGGDVFAKRKPTLHPVRRSVSEDWIASLPREKSQLFEAIVHRWECSFAMASVSLNEALSLRSRGELVRARQQVTISAELLTRIAVALIDACQSISAHGRGIHNIPQVFPLNTEYFKGHTAQSAASWNELLHHVLFADRSRFFQKLRILSETLEKLVAEFHAEALELSDALSIHPNDSWEVLVSHHYDFNTCMRETEILLKSFLRTLPSDQISAFSSELDVTPSPEKLNKLRSNRARSIPQHKHRYVSI